MNRILSVAALLLCAWPCRAGVAEPGQSAAGRVVVPLREGAAVTPDALAAAEWIRGAPPETWEPGKVYFLDCWATWCGPCLAAIPHLNDLHGKLECEGLRVIGLSVWEDDVEKVRAFANRSPGGMDFPVAFAGRTGPFVTDWVAASGALGIPHLFVVKDGILLLTTDPMLLDETAARGLLEGGAAQEEAIASVRAAAGERERLGDALKAFRAAAAARQPGKMDAALAAVAKSDTAGHYTPGLRLEAALVKADWAQAEALLPALPAGPGLAGILAAAARRVSGESPAPRSLRLALRDRLEAAADNPAAFMTLARLSWMTGEKSAAVAAAKRGAEIASSGAASAAPYGKFAEALAAGTLPDETEVKNWFREALTAPAPGKAG